MGNRVLLMPALEGTSGVKYPALLVGSANNALTSVFERHIFYSFRFLKIAFFFVLFIMKVKLKLNFLLKTKGYLKFKRQ